MKQSIEYLLFNSGITNYRIFKETGIAQSNLSDYTTGKTDIGRMPLDNAIKLHNYFKGMLTMLDKKFGSVDYDGVTYYLRDQAEPTSRALLDWQREEGYAHFAAPAVDANGKGYQVEWVLKTVNDDGEGIEDLSELNWDNVDKVVEN